jgi:DNA-binding NtrC family response regulator
MSSLLRILFLAPAGAVTRLFPALRDAGFEVGLAENIKGASAFIRKASPAAIFSRPTLPGYRVEDLLDVGADDPAFPPVIIMADKGSAAEAEHYMGMGAKDYWLEPLTAEKVAAAVPKGARRAGAASPLTTLGGNKPDFSRSPLIIGKHPVIRRALALARQIAPSKATVLISGESGTGKEMFARSLHAWSDRANGPFVAINCAALPEHLLESELFGHEKGAFTGAINRKIGKFEMADGGTILLDEISEMDLPLQAKLLRVLQEGEIDRLGGTETIRVNVRVLATTNRDLAAWVEEGKFRQDLYFRLNVIPLRLPCLRERGDDLLELASFFIDMYGREYRLPHAGLSAEALAWLRGHDWPGNVRELQNLMERAVLLAGGRQISSRHFLLEQDDWPLFDEADASPDEGAQIPAENDAPAPAAPLPRGSAPDLAGVCADALIPLHEMERLMIKKGLEVTSGNRTQAAELLGISVRTLRNKLNEYRGQGSPVD